MADWSTACPNWERRLLAGESLVPDLPLFREEADRALRVFKRLRIPDMVGMPTMGEVAGPWLFPIVEAIFGSYDATTNRRMIQEFFWVIPKKNTKTSSSAAIMVEALILNRRPEGEFNLVAPTKEIADISFRQAAGTIRADPELEKLFQIQTHIRTITHRRMGATLKVKAADTDVITGGKGSTLIDELHVLAGKKNAADIMIEIRGALAARPDGFLIIVTTQSKAPPQGVFKSELAKARAVRDGKMSLPLLPIIYELPERLQKDGVSWKNRSLWPAVNPNLNRSVDLAFLERVVDTAETEGKDAVALVASQHFNVEIGLKLSADRWAGADHWEAAATPLTLDQLLEVCEVVTIGVDGGGLDDLFGLTVIGRHRETGHWLTWTKCWAHKIAVERRKSEEAKLRDFERAGELVIAEHVGDDFDEAVEIIVRCHESGLLAQIGLDAAGVAAFVDAINMAIYGTAEAPEGEDPLTVAVPQGYQLQAASKGVERKLADGTLYHADQAIMDWMVGNAKTEMKGNAMYITKAVSGVGKIDGLMALFDAAYLMARNPQARVTGDIELVMV
jgi:phage terminase large subunit-like protein